MNMALQQSLSPILCAGGWWQDSILHFDYLASTIPFCSGCFYGIPLSLTAQTSGTEEDRISSVGQFIDLLGHLLAFCSLTFQANDRLIKPRVQLLLSLIWGY
jgi:hypothetical protein